MNPALRYLGGYPENLIEQVSRLIETGKLGAWLEQRYPHKHNIKSEKALYDYVQEIKNQYLKKSSPISKVAYDDRIHVVNNALGLHSFVSRAHGGKLKAKNEIRIASMFKDAPEPFLHMLVVHELAHLKEKDHNKAFYQLCCHMEPDYHQLEFDARLYLIHMESQKNALK